MFNKKRILAFVVFVLFMFIFITFAGGTPQNQAIATRLVTFIDGYDNSQISQQKIIVGEDAVVPEDPKHDNLVFAGWYLEEDRNVEIKDFTNIQKDITVIAEYAKDINGNGIADEDDEYFTVTFVDTFNNTTIKTQRVLTGMNATAPRAPSHNGLVFVGWSRAYTNVRKSITVYTVYRNTVVEANMYSVTFIDGDTNEEISIVEVEEGLSATTPIPPVHENRTFDYWDGNYTNVTQNETVTAVYADDINDNQIPDYKEEKYTVTYDAGLENVEGEVPVDENEYLEGIKYTVKDKNTLKLEKAVFIGWTKENPEKIIETQEEEDSLVITMPEAEITMGDNHVTYYAVWASDENENDIPDYLEEKYSVSYEAGLESVEGNVPTDENEYLEGITYIVKENTLTNNNSVFIGWSTTNPEKIITTQEEQDNITIVTENSEEVMGNSDVVYYAVWASDENNNGIADYKEDKFTVEFTSENEELLNGTTKFENILTGLNFYDEVKVPTIIENNQDNLAFDKWNPVLPEESAKVESNLTFEAVFAEDLNNNEIPDYKETKYTVNFVAGENGSLNGTTKYENLLINLTFAENNVVIPTPVANEGYTFDKWTETTPENTTVVTGDLTYTATFAKDENGNNIPDYKEDKFTVEFTSQYEELLSGTTKFENILTGLNFYDEVKVPTIIENKQDNLAFDKWNPVLPEESAKVESNLTFEAIFAEDLNNNEIPDYKETKYTVNFVAGENGSLNGTAKYENLLINLTFAENNVVIPTPVANEGYAFDKWTETTPENTTVVTGDLTYTAVFAIDKNNNDIPDYRDTKYTVEFTSEHEELLNGTTKYENILTGLNFYDEVKVPTIIENKQDNLAFDKWNPVLPEENAKVESNLTFEAIFAEDLNNNEIPDYKETKYTVNFVAGENGSLNGTAKYENLLINLTFADNNVVIPTPVANEGYAFDKWTETTPENTTVVTGNLTYTAVFAIDKNNNNIPDYREDKYIVNFVAGENGSLNGTTKYENLLINLTFAENNVVIPTPVANEGYAFDKWTETTPENTTVVTGNLTYTAVFAIDKNNNDIPDYRDTKYTVEFTSEHEELLNGTTKYENVLTGLNFYDEVKVPTIIENNQDNLAFDKWNPVLPEENAKVESNLTFEAIFAEDLNNNEIPDKDDKKVTIEFVAGENGSLNGTTKYENLLIGLTFEQAGIVIPTPVANENYIFNGWNKEIVKTVEGSETYTATFAPDFNNNKIDDNTEEHFTIEFIAGENGSLNGTAKYENILVDLTFEQAGIVIPTPVANEGYTFDKWTETIPENTTVVTGDLTYTATFAKDENGNNIPDYKEDKFTVEFTSQHEELLSGTTKYENILTGLNFYDEVKVPTIIENKQDNLAFDKWNPVLPEENAKVESNLTFEAVFDEDLNNNEIPDYKETKYTVNFVSGENGSLNGTTKYENLLINLTFAENNVVIPTPVANEGYAFDKWTETTPENTTVVTGNLTYTAVFAIDKNNNNVPDYRDKKYTVEFTSQYNELLNGTTKYENILTGLNFYDEVEVPTIIEVKGDNLAFDKWNPVLPEESAKVESDLTFEAVFAIDLNNNETPDYKETKYTVTFKNDDGKELKTEQVLPGLSATAPSNPTKANTQEYTYEFAGWDNSFTNVTSDLVITATYNSTKNKYTVTFVDYNDTVLGTSTVEYGTSATSPANPTRVNYTFTGWDKSFTNVTENITVKAQYEANLIGIRVEEKANAQLVFQVNSNVDIKNYINVYKKYADGTEELATISEYTTNFTTANVGTDIRLTVTLNTYTDTTITYDITSDVAYQTKFEVLKVSTGYGYRKTTRSNCTSNCDSEANTTFVETEYMVLEMIEHYMENISISSVKGIYQNNTEETLLYTNPVRWSRVTSSWFSGSTTYDPVRILSLKDEDIMTAENPLKYVDITYHRAGYGNYTIRFAYNSNTNEFVAISEVKH